MYNRIIRSTIMSGISKRFKFPGIIKKQKAVSHGLPTFDLGKVTNLRELGLGSFGSVHLGDYVCGVEIQSVVAKKRRGESEDAKRQFVKEAKLPYALMMEYVAFNFAPFGLQKTLYNLEDFYHFVDCEFDFKMFDDVITICMRDIERPGVSAWD